ncbi:MAG: HU family DNA-binding protein [Proteobacteria bacterium]|nr:HU family DNA-binding protein [Pseudomonadota bacterium]
MTKADLIQLMMQDAAISKSQADAALKSLVENITSAVKKEGKLALTGFGTFSKVQRKAREGRNPLTGEKIKIKASRTVKFSAGSKLKAAIQ